MSDVNEILKCMSWDKNIKTISIEFKRMSSGIKMTYETRIGDEMKMGLEFVNAKDFENDPKKLEEAQNKVLCSILESCHKDHEPDHG